MLTACYLAVEVAGLLTNSLAHLADAGHILPDMAGTGLALPTAPPAGAGGAVPHSLPRWGVDDIAFPHPR